MANLIVVFKNGSLFIIGTILLYFYDFLSMLIENIGIYYLIFFTVLILVPDFISYIKKTKTDRLSMGIRMMVFLALLQGILKIEFSNWAYGGIVILASGLSPKESLSWIKKKFKD